MLLVLRILTILFAVGGLSVGGWLIIGGAMDEPDMDTEAIWLGIGVLLYFIADLYLLYRSYKKKHKPTHWVALVLALLPALLLAGLVILADSFFD
jgi:Na+/proline symporter